MNTNNDNNTAAVNPVRSKAPEATAIPKAGTSNGVNQRSAAGRRSNGRRKEAVASIQLVPGEGLIFVNRRPFEKYFLRETDRIIVRQPMAITDTLNKYNVIANIKGGGYSGQAGALRLAIARALSSISEDTKKILRKNGFLTRDPRMKERKKYGQKGARKRFQWTKR